MTKWERNNPYDTGKKITDRMVVSSINNGDYLKVQGVDFSKGTQFLEVSVASINGGTIEIHTDSLDGQLLGTVQVIGKAEGDVFKTIKSPVKNVKGIHDLYFVFKGNKDLFYFDWWKFSSK